MSDPAAVPRTSLFTKYFRALFAAVVGPLLIAGGSEAWFGYHDQRARLNDLLDAEARLAAVKIHDFIEGIRDQLAWTVQLPWSENTGDEHRLDALRLLRQVPAVISLSLVDAAGKERLFVSRIGLNRIESGDDQSAKPAVIGARSDGIWFGPVTFQHGSEPFMTIAVAGNRSAVGVAVAEVNLKFIWEVISAIRVGRTGEAFVLDQPGRLVAHPDISLVLRADETAQRPLQTLRDAILLTGPGQAATGQDLAGKTVLAAMAPIPGVDWSVIVKQPLAEAFAPIYAALWRTGGIARGRRSPRRDARLLADPAHGWADTPAGGRGGPHRRGTIRPPDQPRDRRRIRAACDPIQRDGRRAGGFTGALGTHQPAQALSRAASGRTGRPHR